MAEQQEPFAAYGGGFGWSIPGLMPGELASLARLERLERAEAEREAAERAERIEERRELWRLRRAQELSYRGVPFNFADDRTMVQSESEFLAETWAALDREDARAERAALIASGQLVILDALHAGDVPSPVPESSVGSAPVPAARSRIVDKCRELLHRGGAVPCCCPSCVSVRAYRGA